MPYYILVPTEPSQDQYIPSYSYGFIAAGSVFFHKSGQIWELVGVPRPIIKFFGIRIRPGFYKVGNFTEEELKRENIFRREYLHFGERGEVWWYCSGGGSRRIRLKWRRCSLTEIRLRQIMGSENDSL